MSKQLNNTFYILKIVAGGTGGIEDADCDPPAFEGRGPYFS